MNEMYQRALLVCQSLIGFKIGVTDDEINGAIDNVLRIPLFSDINIEKLKKELLTMYSIRIDPYQILEGKERRQPWLKEFKANKKSDWNFWIRYKDYLEKQKKFAPSVISQLDDLTDTILDKLFNPNLNTINIAKKGLVVGQVQSGKTANYTGLVCKAADAGFNLIIVMAGIHNNLRSQTQNRLDEGFLGFDTQYERAYSKNNTNKIGVGLIPGFDNAIANSYTTSLETGDFNKRATNTAGFNFNSPHPILLVVKKNASVLKRLCIWFKSMSTNSMIENKSLLLIDDEADNASINTNRKELDPTAINSNICNILSYFIRSGYIGYTATPFANIFIPAIDHNNLFPRDFIINLPAPTHYIGPDKVFGTSIIPDDSNNDLLPIVFPINDYESFIPSKHKRDTPKPSFFEIPNSLKIAVKCFIITCAIRIARGQENKHNSMLVHVSRFQKWQNHIKDIVERLFEYYRAEIESGDQLVYEELRNIFEVDADNYKSYKTITNEIINSKLKNIDDDLRIHSWDEIKPLLFRVVQKIEVKSINGTSGDNLTYYDNDKNGISVIAIGGDKLSRGLTLEGLSVSYFLRASKMYDTLMQMGRWFGYRPGYVDLCRLFTSEDLNEWYRHITMASEELRSEFDYLNEIRGTPEDYSLKVRNSPGQLQITSLAKMRYTRQIDISWAGRLIETYQLSVDKQIKNENLISTNDFITSLGVYEKIKNKNFLWRFVSSDKICEFLPRFQLPDSLKKVDLDLICNYIQELVKINELQYWSVALMNKETGIPFNFSNDIQIGCFDRNRAEEVNWNIYHIRKNHIVGNPKDEFIDLDERILGEALELTTLRKAQVQKFREYEKLNINDREEAKIMFFDEWNQMSKSEKSKYWDKEYPAPEIVRKEFRQPSNPLLLIYPLNPECAYKNKEGNYIVEEHLRSADPFIGLVISFPDSKSNITISYTVNQVEEFADSERLFEIDNDNSYDE